MNSREFPPDYLKLPLDRAKYYNKDPRVKRVVFQEFLCLLYRLSFTEPRDYRRGFLYTKKQPKKAAFPPFDNYQKRWYYNSGRDFLQLIFTDI